MEKVQKLNNPRQTLYVQRNIEGCSWITVAVEKQ